jgi:hypothetical protein
VIVGAGMINSGLLLSNPHLTGKQKAAGVALTGVVTLAGAAPAAAMIAGGEKALAGNPQIIKWGVNYMLGLGGTVSGLLDPHANASGGLSSSLDEE